MTFRDILEDIHSKKDEDRLPYAQHTYKDLFTDDLIKFFLVRHANCYPHPLFEYFNYMDLNDYKIRLTTVSTEEIFSLVDYAPPCNLRDEDESDYKRLLDIGFDFWPNGTWAAPILVVKKDGKLLAIDGNNRLRKLRCYIKHSKKPVSDCHKIYLLEKKR